MLNKNDTCAFRDRLINFYHQLQEKICLNLEKEDGQALFTQDHWDRGEHGGGGLTRILSKGLLLEKAGVNVSVVYGQVTETMRKQLNISGQKWFAAGISLVIHPKNPYIPTVHANWRYFELFDGADLVIDRWFGGGADLTPYYLFEEDASHFHRTLKDGMDPFGTELYPRYKKSCDEYFINRHRNNESRGIGGVFYDQLRPADEADAEHLSRFQQAMGNSFLPAYLPIVQRRRPIPYGKRETDWQELRRGRYVEFNLIHDKGTLFGLKTDGRTESILMSLPPRARWEYDYHPEPGTEEDRLVQVCLQPREWVAAAETSSRVQS
jgi:coproporphyrinogen III oxidase